MKAARSKVERGHAAESGSRRERAHSRERTQRRKHAAETDSRRIERCHAGRRSETIEPRALNKAGMADTPTDVGFL